MPVKNPIYDYKVVTREEFLINQNIRLWVDIIIIPVFFLYIAIIGEITPFLRAILIIVSVVTLMYNLSNFIDRTNQ